MGVAILIIVWFHTDYAFESVSSQLLHNFLYFFKELGYGGVDLFLVISGFGVWHSLRKHSVPVFYLNRLKKILPVWWTYMILKLVLEPLCFHTRIRITQILGFAFFTGYWQQMDNQGNWFVYMIMLFYLISPVIFILLYRSRKKALMALLLVLIAAGISVAFFYDERIMAAARLPVFIVGFYLASDQDRFEMTRIRWLACLGIAFFGILGVFAIYKCFNEYLWDWGFWWYPYIILAPAFAVLICGLFHLIARKTLLPGRIFQHLGEASLEILLCSDLIYTYLSDQMKSLIPARGFCSLLLMILGVLAGLVFHFLIELIKRNVFKTEHCN